MLLMPLCVWFPNPGGITNEPGIRVDQAGPAAIRLRFTLPPGSYATVLLREVLK